MSINAGASTRGPIPLGQMYSFVNGPEAHTLVEELLERYIALEKRLPQDETIQKNTRQERCERAFYQGVGW